MVWRFTNPVGSGETTPVNTPNFFQFFSSSCPVALSFPRSPISFPPLPRPLTFFCASHNPSYVISLHLVFHSPRSFRLRISVFYSSPSPTLSTFSSLVVLQVNHKTPLYYGTGPFFLPFHTSIPLPNLRNVHSARYGCRLPEQLSKKTTGEHTTGGTKPEPQKP